jgi:hypothetical protein
MNRIYLPAITEIRMKTLEGQNPLVFVNNNDTEIYGIIAVKYGFPDTIKQRTDYINPDNSIQYDKMIGRKFLFQLIENGSRINFRCTIINPNVADYTGYLFPKRLSPRLSNLTLIKLEKEDYLTTKEKIMAPDIDHLQLKLDGLDHFQNMKRKIREERRKKKIKEKVKEKIEKKKLLSKGFTDAEINSNNLSKKKKIVKDKNKLMKGYLQTNTNHHLDSIVTNHHGEDSVDPEMTPIGGNIENHDIRISEEDEEIRKNQKVKKDEDEVTEEISFQHDITYFPDQEKEVQRQYSSQKDLEKYQAEIHKDHHHSHSRLLKITNRKRNPLCII